MQTKLGSSIRLVTLRFSFTNPDVVPSCIKQLSHETQEEAVARKAMPIPGQPVIQPTEDASLVGLPSMLEQVGYELVDAFYKPRIDQKSGRTYHMVCFVFAHHDYVNLSDEFKRVRNTIRVALNEVCTQAMWRVRSFINPFFKNRTRSEDQNVLSLNFEARKPLLLPNGQPVVVWQRDANGEKVGEAPLAAASEGRSQGSRSGRSACERLIRLDRKAQHERYLSSFSIFKKECRLFSFL